MNVPVAYVCRVFAIIVLCQHFAAADLVSVTVENPSSTVAGTIVNDIKISFTDQVTTQELLITLTAGSIYQDTFGTDTPPSAALIGVFPSVAFDSFVALGSLVASPITPSIAGGAVDIGGSSTKVFDASSANIAWFSPGGTIITDKTSWPIARITLSDDAEGHWRLLSTTSTGYGYISGTVPSLAGPSVDFGGGLDGAIHGGVMSIPEPSALTYVGVACAVTMLARRRAQASKDNQISQQSR